MAPFPSRYRLQPCPSQVGLLFALLSGMLSVGTALGFSGHLDDAGPVSMTIAGTRYRVAPEARVVPLSSRQTKIDLYTLGAEELERLPHYDFRRFRAVERVRVRLDSGVIRVILPVEFRR